MIPVKDVIIQTLLLIAAGALFFVIRCRISAYGQAVRLVVAVGFRARSRARRTRGVGRGREARLSPAQVRAGS